MRLQKYTFILAAWLIQWGLSAQETTPVVYLWDKASHHCANQMWSTSSDDRGNVYFGNADGLLSFDSVHWEIHPLPGNRTVRSTMYDNGRIYVGSFEEFGYFERNVNGELFYTSLSDRISEYEMSNDEIWTILKQKDDIYFHSFSTLFIYNTRNNKVTTYKTGEFIESIALGADENIFCSAGGFASIDERGVTYIPHPWKGRMVSALPWKDSSSLVITQDEGIYVYDHGKISKWTTDCEDMLRDYSVNRAIVCSNGDIILGSSLYGAAAIDSLGHKKWFVNASNVLNGNTILGICENRDGNIFFALDSGVCLLDNNSGLRYINTLDAKVGAIYCVFYKRPLLYIGSNQGLYAGRLDDDARSLDNVQRIRNVSGPVLYLDEFDGTLFCGTNAETFTLEGRTAHQISLDNAGGGCMARGVINGQEVLIEGTYTKLCLYKKENGRYIFKHRIDGFLQPVSTIDVDYTGTIWAGHTTRGMYKLTLDEKLSSIKSQRYYESLDGEHPSGKIRISRINGRTVFYDNSKIYTYDDMQDKIVPYKTQGDSRIDGILGIDYNPQTNSYWLLNADDAFLVDFSEERPHLQNRLSYSLFNSATVDLLREIRPGPHGWSIMTLNNSLAFIPEYKDSTVRKKWQPVVTLEKVSISKSDGAEKELLPIDEPLEWNYDSRLVDFQYSYPDFDELGSIHLEYRLKGRDQVWRKSENFNVDLSNLPEGRHTLNVRIINTPGEILDSTDVDFRIRPPFYRSTIAKILYVLLGILTCAFIVAAVRRRMEQQKRELENKRLESELAAKNREITTTTMNLLSKNKILQDIKEELSVQKGTLGAAYPDKYYRKMIEVIDSQISSDEDWARFQKNFDTLHGDFFKILKSRYPTLTDSDLRFCSYLCMNMSSKEIASMMNISLKGVEAARYRIRKKIGLPSEISLTSFLMDLK